MRRLCLLLILAAVSAVFAGGASAAAPTDRSYIVVLKDGTDPGRVAAEHRRSAGAEVEYVYSHALDGYAARLSAAGLGIVRSDKRVAYVTDDGAVSAVGQTLPTGIDRIDGDLSSVHSGSGLPGVTVNINVAVIDTGIDLSHPELNVVGGTNCSTGTSFADGNGHGTHVAGTIAAKDNAEGVVGVVPGANLYAVRVLDNTGSGTFSSVICGIDWVTATRTDSNTTNDIAVANMSLGGSGSDDGNCGNSNNDALHKAICNSTAAGVTYVVAAGNSAADFKGFVPAAYDEALTVTAMSDSDGKSGGTGGAPTCRTGERDDYYASFSNFAILPADQSHTIAAPGVCILSTWLGSSYNTISGTSMASPHAAGTAALCIASGACAGLTPAGIVSKLRGDAKLYSDANPGYGFYGDPNHQVPPKPTGRSGKVRPSPYFGYLIRAGLPGGY